MQTEPLYTSGQKPLSCAEAIDALQSLGVYHRTAVDTLKVAVRRGTGADLYHGGRRFHVSWHWPADVFWDPIFRSKDIYQYQYIITET